MDRRSPIFDTVQRAGVPFPPLTVRAIRNEPAGAENLKPDALWEIIWQSLRYTFLVEATPLSTPKAIQSAADAAIAASKSLPGFGPMVVVPYLSEEQIDSLEARGVSGLDLSGNGIVVVPGELLVRKVGKPNAYPQSTPIRNVYQGSSSLVPRVLLSRPLYPSVNEVYAEIARRGGTIVLSTVSKALKALADDLIITRQDAVRLVQPEKLVDKLLDAYRPPRVRARWAGKAGMNEAQLASLATDTAAQRGGRLVSTLR